MAPAYANIKLQIDALGWKLYTANWEKPFLIYDNQFHIFD